MQLNLLTAVELAHELRVTPSAVRAWTRKGLPARRFGRCVRFHLAEVLAWFDMKQALGDGSEEHAGAAVVRDVR